MGSNDEQKKSKAFYYILGLLIVVIAIAIFYIRYPREKTYNFNNNIREELFIAIDFGNSKTSFAYNFGRNNKIIKGQMRSVPSIIILNKKDLTGKNFGTKSINSISNYNEDEMNNIIYMDNLKIKFYNKSNNDNNTDEYSDKAIIEFLRLFSDEILKEINYLGQRYIKDEIKWIITVPRIWDDFTKINLINLAKKAGMNNIELALDSEVGAISVLNDKIINNKLKTTGKKFLLIDLGDYNIDISLNEIYNNNIKQLSIPLGCNLGSMNINNDLIKVIENVVGKEILMKAKENQFDEYLKTLKGLEDIKIKVKENSSDYFEVYAKFEREKSWKKWIYSNWISIKSIFKRKKYFMEIKYENYTINIDDFKIYIPGKLVEEIILKRVNEVISYIKSYNIYIKNHDYIILTGGFSNCEILVNEFRKNFKNVFVLSNQENSILEGALIFLNNKQKIYSFVSYNTYGIGNFNQNNSTEEIKILIKKGDIINSDFYISKYLDPYPIKSDFMCINFYKSNNEFISKDNFFGTLEIYLAEYKNINPDKFSLNLIIKFNTYFQIEVNDSKTNKKINFSFNRKQYPKIYNK